MSGFGWASVVVGGVTVALVVMSCGGAANDAPRGASGTDSTLGGAKAVANPSAGAADASVDELPSPRGRHDGQPLLGHKCGKDADCGGDGLRCLSANEDYMDGRGAPSGGICTADCANDDNCRAFDASAVCAALAEAPLISDYVRKPVHRLCLLGCKLGAPSGNAKCHGRTDLACRPFGPEPTQTCANDEECPAQTLCYRGACREVACGPRCNDDADCSGERLCNPLTGLCDELAPTPVPLGLPCLGELDTTAVCGGGNCLSVFARLDSPTGPHVTRVKEMCTQSCTLGTVCGNGAGACIAPKLDNYALGDAGYCVQKCDCDADCLNPSDRCLAWNDEEVARHYGSRGTCDYAAADTPSLDCDGRGGAGHGGADGSGN